MMIKCRYYRRIISRSADEDTPLPAPAQAHVAECHECRRHYETEHDIVRSLSAGAAAHRRSQPPPFLHPRIMAQIASSQPIVRPASRPFWFHWSAALAAACIVLTTILLWPGRPVPKPSPGPIARVLRPSPVENASAKDRSDAALLAGWAANPDQPLETEMRAVMQDARGAVIALADNFFPDELRQTLLAETPSRR